MYKLLIIEDDDDIRENIKEVFELSGDNVFTASNGEEGIKLISKIKPDLILCDISMPMMDGFQVKKSLEANAVTSTIPFIFLTAKADMISMREGMNLGADDYIVKPIRAKELVETVHKRIERLLGLKSNIEKLPEKKVLTIEDQIPLNTGKERLFVPIKNIVVIIVKEDYTMVYTSEQKKFIIKKTIKSWESMLPDKIFIRAHRNILLNINYVEKIEPWFNSSLIGKIRYCPEMLKFSKRYSQKIKRMMKE